MKKIIFLITLAAALTSRGQSYFQSAPFVPSTNAVPAATTNSAIRLVIPAPRGLDLTISPSFVLTGTGATPVILRFDESLDAKNWASATRSISVTANGTNAVSEVQNFTIGASGYLRLSSVENPNGSGLTNLVVRVAQKGGDR